jgi:hypothetical protein
MDSALQSRPLQYQKVKEKAKLLYRAYISRSAAENETEVSVREALPSVLDATAAALAGQSSNDAYGIESNALKGQNSGNSLSRGSQLWKNIAPWQEKDLTGGALIGKLSDEVADLKNSMQEVLKLLRTRAHKGTSP